MVCVRKQHSQKQKQQHRTHAHSLDDARARLQTTTKKPIQDPSPAPPVVVYVLERIENFLRHFSVTLQTERPGKGPGKKKAPHLIWGQKNNSPLPP
jgi:hypothetical protein